MLIVEERFEEAIDEFQRILEETPDDYYSREQIAEIYAGRLKRYRQAIEEYGKLLEMNLDENHIVSTLNRLADLCGDHIGNSGQAIASLEEIIRRFPGSLHAERAQMRLKEYRN